MNFRIFGSRRSVFICAAPLLCPGFFEPRSFLRMAIGPFSSPPMVSLPRRVSLTISAPDIAPTIASQCGARAASAGSTFSMCGSRKSMVQTMMSARAMSA